MIEEGAQARECERQRLLVRVLQRQAPSAAIAAWVSDGGARSERGCRVYLANAAASAERALAASYPTVRALIGAESFAALARAHWHADAPERGDLAWFGAALPQFIATSEQLASEPYLSDCARLDWAVGRAEIAADARIASNSLALLGQTEAESLLLQLTPGSAVLSSPHPIARIWLAHHGAQRTEGDERFAHVRAAFAAGAGEHAWLWREGWSVRVVEVDAATASFLNSLLAGCTLGAALDQAGGGFDFQAWLVAALQGSALQRADVRNT